MRNRTHSSAGESITTTQRGKKTARRYKVPFLLPVRGVSGGARFWQALKTWLRLRWQTWRTKRIVFLPPVQPARHNSLPQRPHQQRRQAVFATLDTAPTGLTRRHLIAHVRSITGVGCSEKLITEWRKVRRRESENEIRGSTGTRRPAVFGLLVCLSFNACAATATMAPPAAMSRGSSLPVPTPMVPSGQPRLLRIKLTLDAPGELRIKAGQQIEAGSLLSDRQVARRHLLLQKRALQTARQYLQTQMQLTAESVQQLQSLGLDLPPTTFAADQAALKRAETEAIAAQRTVEIQQEKVSGVRDRVSGTNVATVPRHLTPDTWHLITQHEEAKLTQAQDKQLLTRSEIEWHQAKLTTAREVRAWEEKKHRVEVTRQLLAARSQQQQAEIELARLTAQVTELELRLGQLAAVRAPFAGTIKRIEWEEMNDEKITVVVYLAVTNG